MNWVGFGFQLVNLLLKLAEFFQQQQWYNQGKAAAYAELDAESVARLKRAEAARAAPDPFADGRVHDPDRRD